MTYTIHKQFAFSASHQLAGLPADHPCSRLHGHNYLVELELASSALNPVGFVVDYRELDPMKAWLNETFDHRHINDILPMNPTAENMAAFICNWAVGHWGEAVKAVRVSETPSTWAEYRRSP